jgi:predicted dehydrogenase
LPKAAGAEPAAGDRSCRRGQRSDAPDGARELALRGYYRDAAAWLREGRIGNVKQAQLTLLTSGVLPGPDGLRPALERQPFMRREKRMLVAEVLIHHLDTLRMLLGRCT